MSIWGIMKSIPADQWPEPGPDADEMLAWLYGREPEQGYTSVVAEWDLGDGFKVLRIASRVTIGDDDKHIVFTLDEAEVLRAVEEARRG